MNYYILLVSLSSKFKGQKLNRHSRKLKKKKKINKTSLGVWYALLTVMMTEIRHMSLLLIKI